MPEAAARTRGLTRALRELAVETRFAALHRAGVDAAVRYRGERGLRLNLGCGDKPLAGWVNLDLAGRPDLTLDLREPLPFDEGAAARVYSEHFLEHLEPGDALRLLAESLRVLEPGGELRVGVPDTEGPVHAYAAGEEADYFRLARERWHPPTCRTRMQHLNYHFRQNGEHRYAYDLETLRLALLEAGFAAVEASDFDPTLDSEDRRLGTLYVAARKAAPGAGR